MSARILIIDDEDLFRENLARLLRDEGHECETAPDGAAGLDRFESFAPDVVLCDIAMPGVDGIGVLDRIMENNPESFVVMVTAYGTLETAVEAFRKGASDYIMKPLVLEDVLQKINRLMKYKRLAQEVTFLRRQVSQDLDSFPMVGQSEPMHKVTSLIEDVAPTRSTVLITGESGTGKELVARAIHRMSHVSEGHADDGVSAFPFVPINCAGIPAELLESELFGHVRGAFTGATRDRAGHFELAGEGTILLDEIAEMPLALQSKLLRVLQEKEFVRVGGMKTIPLKARIVASTNRDLRERVKANEFREDLFFRIAVFEIPLPPLRERWNDIPLLVESFIESLNDELKRRCMGVDDKAMARLLSHAWPGNVRELRNVVERAMILCKGDWISLAELPGEFQEMVASPKFSDELREAMRVYEAEHIRRVLHSTGWNKEKAARRLGIHPSTLYRKMEDQDILGLEESPPSRST